MNPATDISNSTRYGRSLWLVALALIVFGLIAPLPAAADGLPLLSLSARVRLSNQTTLGDPQPEEFAEYTLAAHCGLPWQSRARLGWVAETRLMASAGLLQGGGENGLVFSLVPEIGFRHERSSLLLDMGFGATLLSRYQLGNQDFGGPFQFALTSGISIPLYKRLGIGYRFMHYSDAGLNGEHTVGADFHMIEFYYNY